MPSVVRAVAPRCGSAEAPRCGQRFLLAEPYGHTACCVWPWGATLPPTLPIAPPSKVRKNPQATSQTDPPFIRPPKTGTKPRPLGSTAGQRGQRFAPLSPHGSSRQGTHGSRLRHYSRSPGTAPTQQAEAFSLSCLVGPQTRPSSRLCQNCSRGACGLYRGASARPLRQRQPQQCELGFGGGIRARGDSPTHVATRRYQLRGAAAVASGAPGTISKVRGLSGALTDLTSLLAY